MQITLSLVDNQGNYSNALKLHKQFAHPSQEKLLQLIQNAGKPWCNNKNLKDEIKNV